MPEQQFFSRIVLAVSLLLAACTPVAPSPITESGQGAAPTPAQIQVWDGATMRTFAPSETPFPDLSAALNELLTSTGARARTFYTPARFQEEITVGPYFLADYGQVVTVDGRGLNFLARRLVVAVVDNELLVLVQSEDGGDWSVFLPVDPDARGRFVAAVRDATGVEMQRE